VSDCCEQLFSVIFVRTFIDQLMIVCFVQDQHAVSDSYIASSLKQQSRGRHVTILLKIYYYHQSYEFKPCSWCGVFDTISCDKVCQWLVTGLWFSPGTLVYSTNVWTHNFGDNSISLTKLYLTGILYCNI
jgi:hypothetical protein